MLLTCKSKTVFYPRSSPFVSNLLITFIQLVNSFSHHFALYLSGFLCLASPQIQSIELQNYSALSWAMMIIHRVELYFTGFHLYWQVQHWDGYLLELTLSASSYFEPNQCSGQGTKWIPSFQKPSTLYFQLPLTPLTSHRFHIDLKSASRMWRSWNFVFSLEDWRRSRGRVGGWGGWSGVLSNELCKMGTAK